MREDRSYVMPLYHALLERRDRLASSIVSDGDAVFPGKFTNLRSVGSDWLLKCALAHSDLSVPDLVAAQTYSDDALYSLVSLACQIPALARLPIRLASQQLLWNTLEARAKDVASQLGTWKADGGLTLAGMIDWSKGRYDVVVDKATHFIKTVAHRPSGQVVDVSEHRIAGDTVLRDNWSDAGARLEKAPLPPIKLSTLFEKGKGPHSMRNIAKAKLFEDFVTEVEADAEVRKRAHAPELLSSAAEVATAAKLLDDIASQKRKQSMQEARQKAQQHLAAKKQRGRVKLMTGMSSSPREAKTGRIRGPSASQEDAPP